MIRINLLRQKHRPFLVNPYGGELRFVLCKRLKREKPHKFITITVRSYPFSEEGKNDLLLPNERGFYDNCWVYADWLRVTQVSKWKHLLNQEDPRVRKFPPGYTKIVDGRLIP